MFVRTTIFRLCILHGILCARQEFGARAMVKEYPFGVYDLEHAISLCIQLCVDQEISDSTTIMKLCFSVIDVSIILLLRNGHTVCTSHIVILKRGRENFLQ